MFISACRLGQAMRWLPLVVVVGLAGPSIAGWGSAVTVMAQADSEDQQPAATPAPAVDGSPPVGADMPADAAMPAPEERLPAADDTPPPQPRPGDMQMCFTVTSTSDGRVSVVTQPASPTLRSREWGRRPRH